MVKTRIAVFVSGGGTNLQALLDAEKRGEIPSGEIVLVLSDSANAYALERAKAVGVSTAICSRKGLGSQEAFEAAIRWQLDAHRVDMIILAGFLNILSADFTGRWPDRIINVHPSLIPAFCGKGFYGLRVHQAALDYGVKVTGATVHYVNEIPDGGQIILQKAVEIQEDDTAETLQRRVMEQAEWVLLPRSAELVAHRLMEIRRASMNIYEVKSMGERIAGNPYVGRGVVIGCSADGSKAVFAYFIMGRSVNSRNRVFVKTPDGIRTEAFDPAKLADPSLIIYTPVRRCGDSIVVTNGDQTDTICDDLSRGGNMESALETRTFEPDDPNFTPRISGQLQMGEGFRYKMSILKSMDEAGTACTRQYFHYDALPGLGHFIHTYVTDGDPIPTFVGEPERVAIPNDIDDFTADIWEHLDESNKISLYVSYTDSATGAEETRLINKNN